MKNIISMLGAWTLAWVFVLSFITFDINPVDVAYAEETPAEEQSQTGNTSGTNDPKGSNDTTPSFGGNPVEKSNDATGNTGDTSSAKTDPTFGGAPVQKTESTTGNTDGSSSADTAPTFGGNSVVGQQSVTQSATFGGNSVGSGSEGGTSSSTDDATFGGNPVNGGTEDEESNDNGSTFGGNPVQGSMTDPVITLIGYDPVLIETGSTFSDDGATATDAEEGDLTAFIVVTGTVDTGVAGTYTRTYTITDSHDGSDSVTRNVIVSDPETTSKSSGSRRSSGKRKVTPVVTGEVLGATTEVCEIYLHDYIFPHTQNDALEVNLLKVFLNQYFNVALVIDGVYDTETQEYVKLFQVAESAHILTPWVAQGFDLEPTANVYITTLHRINEIKCEEANGELPALVPLSTPATNTQIGIAPVQIQQSVQGVVLGVSTEVSTEACGIYLTDLLNINWENDGSQVNLLKDFLNKELGIDLERNGIFDTVTFEAVSRLQLKHSDLILEPWGQSQPTGHVGETTQWFINQIECSNLNLAHPIL